MSDRLRGRSGDRVDVGSVLESQGSDDFPGPHRSDLLQSLSKLFRCDLGVGGPLLGGNPGDGSSGLFLLRVDSPGVQRDLDVVRGADLLHGFPGGSR